MLILIVIKLVLKTPLILLALSYQIPASFFKKPEKFNPKSKKFSYSFKDYLYESEVLPLTPSSPPKLALLITCKIISSLILTLLILLALIYKVISCSALLNPYLQYLHDRCPRISLKLNKISRSINYDSLFTTKNISENTFMTIVCFNSPPILIYNTLIAHKSILEAITTKTNINIKLIDYIFTTI